MKKVFLKILQNSQENTYVRAPWPATLLKKEAPTKLFPRKFYDCFWVLLTSSR